MSRHLATPSTRRVSRLLYDGIGKARDLVASNARVRNIAYAMRNRSAFGDLRQHDRMLADTIRTDAYWDGLQRHIKDGDTVADLGTGTGILALFAIRAGAAHVDAIEHGPMADVAEAVARANGVETITVHRLHSRSFTPSAPVDVIIHEQIGEALFDEHVVENVTDLRDRVLRPGGAILPAHLELFIEPVQLTDEARTPYAFDQQIHGIEFSALKPYADAQPFEYQYEVLRPFPFGRWLAEREAAVTVDLHTIAGAGDLPTSIDLTRTVTHDGTFDGMVVYFRAGFDEAIWFTSAPDQPPTSWGSPFLRTRSTPVRAGQTISFSLTATNLSTPSSWRWTMTVDPAT